MNTYAIIIVAALAVDYVLNIVADILNLKAMKKEIPDDFQSVYDEDDYRKSQEYTKEGTKFGLLTTTFDMALLFVFWFSGGFNWLDQMIRGFGYSDLVNGLLFIGVLSVVKSLISLPFSLYSTFVIEEKYGFNNTSTGTFFADLLKGLGLGVVIGLPILALILWVFQSLGTWAWLYGWIAVTLFSLIMQYVAPMWIMPLFNKFEPLEDEELRKMIMNYAEKVKFSLTNIFVMDGSKRSSKSNAFFTGFGKHKRVALFDTLIEKHTKKELLLVLAHEIGHYKHKHIVKNMVISTAHTGVLFFLLGIFLNDTALFDAFYMQEMSVYAGLLFFGLLYTPVEMILGLGMNLLSRKHEFEADAFAAQTTGEAETMVQALKKLSKDNLSNLTPHPFYVLLHYSHPPVRERIQALSTH